MTIAIRTLSWSGATTADVRDELLMLDSAAPDIVSPRPHYVYAEPPATGADHNQTAQAELFALSIDDGKPDQGDEKAFFVVRRHWSKAFASWLDSCRRRPSRG